MSKSKNTKQRGPKPKKRNEVILKLREHKRATSAELNVPTAFMFTLLQKGYVIQAGKQEKEGRGRKKVQWKLSPKGNGIASSLQRQISAAA